MSVLTYDLETCTSTLHKRKASPFHPDNYIVAAGFKRDDGPTIGTYYTSAEAAREQYVIPFEDDDTLLVGFNIKFDLLYSWHRPELAAFFHRGGKIWDCQYAEYLLEGHRQHAQMCSMDSVVESYGGTLKIDAVKELWQEGVNTPDIDEDLLMDYLLGNEEEGIAGDVNNTYLIYLGQLERAKKQHPHFLAMLERRMDGLLATTEMEYNGLRIDTLVGNSDRAAVEGALQSAEQTLEEFIPPLPDELTFNWGSAVHRSALIFGGHVPYKKWVQHTDEDGTPLFAKASERWPLFEGVAVSPTSPDITNDGASGLYRRVCDSQEQDVFKSGKRQGEGKTKTVQVDDLLKPKGAQQDFAFRFKGFTKPAGAWRSESQTDAKGKPIYSTAAGIVEKLTARADVPFLVALGQRTKLSKELGTYYWALDKQGHKKGMLTLVGDGDIIHHSLNHTSTITSRLSGNNPNMQNLPRSDEDADGIAKSNVKRMFVSRFGDDGVMAELDYSQLEVVIQAVLSNDPQMIQDLLDKVDFHCKRLAKKLGCSYAEVRALYEAGDHDIKVGRTNAKEFSFQRAYGAAASSIADSTGMTEEDVLALISAEEALYPGVIAFDNMVEQSIINTATVTKREVYVDGKRFNARTGEWSSPTGTRYVWTESASPEFMWKHGKYITFSPTERKNWPIQGDGGFVVQAMLGYLWRMFNRNHNFGGKALLVNTVHDCVWIDLHKDVVHEVIPYAKAILEAVPQMYKRAFNIDIPVPFPCEAEVGPNMQELTHYNPISK